MDLVRRTRKPCLFAAALALVASGTEGGEYKVVVHPSNPATSVSRANLAALFLGKSSLWPHGGPALPVDRLEDAPVREEFSREILGRSASAAKSYWLQRLFSGRGLPPPEKQSERDVLEYVQSHPGGIGYVESPTPDVKVLKVEP